MRASPPIPQKRESFCVPADRQGKRAYFGLVVNDCPYIVGGLQTCAMMPCDLFKVRKFRSIFFWSAFVTLPRIARSFFSAFSISLVIFLSVKLILAMLFSLYPAQRNFLLLEDAAGS
jgi:hypothetical protein